MWIILQFAATATLVRGNPFISAPISDLDSFRTFSSLESSNYKTLTLSNDFKTLYIGAQDRVFVQKSDDITSAAFSPVVWPVVKDDSCKTLPQSNGGKKCKNLIQIVQPLNDTHIVICGTNFLTPKNKLLVKQNGESEYSLVEDDLIKSTLCSFDPTDSVTSSLVPSDKGGNIFSTPRSDIHEKISLVKATQDSLIMSNENMQEGKSTIVASFTAQDTAIAPNMLKVYFVSDEKTGETGMPPPAPTITQVCANDVGGKYILTNRWTSLLKVRLLCQTEDADPLKFDLVSDMVAGRDGLFYGTFMTRHDTYRVNAVCSYKLSDVQKAFNEADFWDTQQKPAKKVKAPAGSLRPGMCAYPGMIPGNPAAATSKDFPSQHLTFMSSHSLVADVVKPAYLPASGDSSTKTQIKMGPLFIKSGKKFTKIAVDQVTDLYGLVHDVVFIGKEDGFIHKFVSIVKDNSLETVELAQYRPTTRPIISMKLSQPLGQLFVGTSESVHQLSTANCAAYTTSCEFCDPCRMCILSRDPGCAWDKSTKKCVSVRGGSKDNLLQDVSHGDAATQCGELGPPKITEKNVGTGETEILGYVIKNPSVVYAWYKVKDTSTKIKISDKSGKYRITMDGQLEIENFNPSEDASKYECEYMVNSATVYVSSYDVKSGSYSARTASTPLIIVSPRSGKPVTDPTKNDDSTGNPHTGIPNTSSTTTALTIAGLVFAFLLIVVIVAVMIFYKRRRKYSTRSPTGVESNKELGPLAIDGNGSPSNQDNATNNNNSRLTRIHSELDDRSSRPLLTSNQRQSTENSDPDVSLLERPSSGQRNAKSLDNILDGQDELEYIDDDAASDRGPARQSSLRESTGRKRVPPSRTKSMPGSNLYVMFGGKKLKCSTLQRNKQGTWTIEVQPNQSGMSDLTQEQDEVIDIINDNDGPDVKEIFTPSPDNMLRPKPYLTAEINDARKAFFGGAGNSSNDDGMPMVQCITSTPNSRYVTPKPRIAPKPSHLSSFKKPPAEQTSRASLRSFGQNSSEERDSDSTVKGSSVTLKPDETPPFANSRTECSGTHKHTHAHERDGDVWEFPTLEPTSDVPTPTSSGKKRKNKQLRAPKNGNQQFFTSSSSLDRSSGSSDGDEQLHGRDKDVKKTPRLTPLDSPSKQSRTSQGSSSSGDYKSARSSVIEPSQEHR